MEKFSSTNTFPLSELLFYLGCFIILTLRVLVSAGKSNTSRTIIAIAVPVASVVLALSLFCIYLTVRKPRKKIESKALNMDLPSYVVKKI